MVIYHQGVIMQGYHHLYGTLGSQQPITLQLDQIGLHQFQFRGWTENPIVKQGCMGAEDIRSLEALLAGIILDPIHHVVAARTPH